MLTVALTVVQVVPGYQLQPKCVFITFLFTVAHHREQSLVNKLGYPVETAAHTGGHSAIFDAAKLPFANARFWPLVAGHDRQLSCWICYTSTVSTKRMLSSAALRY